MQSEFIRFVYNNVREMLHCEASYNSSGGLSKILLSLRETTGS